MITEGEWQTDLGKTGGATDSLRSAGRGNLGGIAGGVDRERIVGGVEARIVSMALGTAGRSTLDGGASPQVMGSGTMPEALTKLDQLHQVGDL